MKDKYVSKFDILLNQNELHSYTAIGNVIIDQVSLVKSQLKSVFKKNATIYKSAENTTIYSCKEKNNSRGKSV